MFALSKVNKRKGIEAAFAYKIKAESYLCGPPLLVAFQIPFAVYLLWASKLSFGMTPSE